MAQATGATYGNDPAGSALDEVRLLIGDTVCTKALLLDSEIQFFLTEEGSAPFAAPLAAEAIAAKLCRDVDVSTGSVSKSLSQAAEAYRQLAKTLRARAEEQGGAPIFTALRKSDKLNDRLDADLVQPQFRIGQDDNPRKVARGRDESIGTTSP